MPVRLPACHKPLWPGSSLRTWRSSPGQPGASVRGRPRRGYGNGQARGQAALGWHTTDYGETWELNELPGAYAFDLSFPPGQNATGYSTVLTPALSRLARYA